MIIGILPILLLSIIPAWAQYLSIPYSATQTTQTVRTLLDGTHLTQPERKVVMYRDSRGRTRNDVLPVSPTSQNLPMPPAIINIMDPVAGFRYMLNTQTKVAFRHPINVPGTAIPAATAMINVTGNLGAAAPSPPATRQAPANRSQSKSEAIGTQAIEGLICDGHRISTTYPTGLFGNDRDLVATSEDWFSQELKVMVLSKQSDPRQGETVMKLTDISRAEPDPALFMVPPDYTIQDQPPFGAPKQ